MRIAQEKSGPTAETQLGAEPTRRFVGDYELIREIGRGGMGVVYEARQRSLNRTVALKLILAGEFASETAIARFRDEAEIIASLSHPNIVPIHEIGEHQGFHYYSMGLIAGGGNLAAPDSDRSSSPRSCAMLLAKIARAVHFAHQRAIIHRDLSPENILLDEEGEPFVTDFGMARLLNREHRFTCTRVIVGKPDYMAPEQADPAEPRLTTAADIFSLGAILYHLLTGERPFAAATPLATLERIRYSEPTPPRRLNPAVDRDLETVCLKCLAKDPSGRYESAAALADDLDRWLRGEPILARPLNAFESSWKWVRRNPLKAAFAVVAIFALLGPLVTTSYLYFFVLPQQARSHPIVGADPRHGLFTIEMDPKRADRLSMNFDTFEFRKRPRLVQLYFTNLPPESVTSTSNLRCQVMADIPGAPDEPRGPVARPGEPFTISSPHWRDRAYYIAPLGWQGQDAFAAAPEARICIVLSDPK